MASLDRCSSAGNSNSAPQSGAPGAPGAPAAPPAAPGAANAKRIQDLTFTCQSDSDCPSHQGLLLAVKADGSEVLHCSATAFEARKILTSGVCAAGLAGGSPVYFKTVAKKDRPSQLVQVRAVSAPAVVPEFVALELTADLKGIAFSHLLAGEKAEPREVLALVAAAPAGAKNQIVLSAVPCLQTRNLENPVGYSENPTSFSAQNCTLKPEQGGSLVVAKADHNSVLGMLQWNAPVSLSAGPAVSNARCAKIAGWSAPQTPCVPVEREKLSALAKSYALDQLSLEMLEKSAELESECRERHHSVPSTLRFSVEPVAVRNVPKVVLIPVPLCFESAHGERDLSFSTVALSYGSALYPDETVHLVAAPARVSIEVNLTHKTGDTYLLSYTLDQAVAETLAVTPTDRLGRLEAGEVVSVPACSPDEQGRAQGVLRARALEVARALAPQL